MLPRKFHDAMGRTIPVGDSRIPARELLGLVFTLVLGLGLLGIAANEAGSTDRGWLVLAIAATASIVLALGYTLTLVRQKRFFLREADGIERNEEKIARVGVPLGWALLPALLVASLIFRDKGSVLIPSVLGGLILGFWPGMLANFLRLRREVWSRGDEVS